MSTINHEAARKEAQLAVASIEEEYPDWREELQADLARIMEGATDGE